MGKLGKKARKFARKHLPSVLKQRRKFKSMRDSSKRKSVIERSDEGDADQATTTAHQSVGGNPEVMMKKMEIGDIFMDNLGIDDDFNSIEDADSDSDGFLSEDLDCPYIAEAENVNDSEDDGDRSALLGQNRTIQLEITKQKRKLDKLKKKDPEFSKFLESHSMELQQLRSNGNYSDEEGEPSDQNKSRGREGLLFEDGKVVTSSTIDVWRQLIMEQQNMSALPSLLNAFRAACHYGSDHEPYSSSCLRIQNREAFYKVLMFLLHEADGIFRRLLGISSSGCKRETLLELQNTSRWKTTKPMLKSYLRSTLYLLNQITDCQILVFAISQLRASIIFFAAFPALLRRLVKVSVHLWVTGEGSLSLVSFIIMRDMASQLNLDCFDSLLTKTYIAFAAHCKFAEPADLKHIQFLADSIVELYSLDMPKAYQKAVLFLQQLAIILQRALKTKKKEAVRMIYNWQYINCIDLWVKFVCANIKDYDLQPLLYLLIQMINGIAHLFPGPRYLPLRLKCIQMLNQLSNSARVFIPIASLVLDSLEYRENNKTDAGHGKPLNFSSVLKVPKHFLKSQGFQEECVLSAIEQLSGHFAQWSYHVSFPELASIPLIRLRKFHEKTSLESLRRLVKRLIDQVERNVEYVQKKRDEVSFSPKDHTSIDSFLQVEKNSGNAPFTQYYASILQKSLSRNAAIDEKAR